MGHASYLRTIDENKLIMILKDSDSHHQGGVGMMELVHRKKLIKDAFVLYEHIENRAGQVGFVGKVG